MDAKATSVFNILKVSLELFKKKGFDSTSMREIATVSGVSLGLINHYFLSKDFLGTQCLMLIDRYATHEMPTKISIDDEPILCDLVALRAFYQYMMRNGFELLYMDSLRNDFFFKYLSDRPSTIVQKLSRFYHITGTPDEIQLYCRYLPYMMEKTLVLKKAEGLFQSISKDQIPYYVVQTALTHFIPEADIAAQDPLSIKLSDELIAPLERDIPEDFIQSFVETYLVRLADASNNTKSQMIHQMNQNRS